MLTEIPNGWECVSLGQVAKRVRRPLSGSPENILMITSTGGFVPQSDKYSRFMAGDSLKKYVELHKGEFAYNKGNSKTYPQGCVFRLDDWDQAAVPNVYFSFKTNDARIESDFAAHFFTSGGLNYDLKRVITSGARSNGLLNLSPEDFFGCKLPLPPLPEQHKIAAILSSVDEAIQATQAVIEQTRRVKEGLLQVLLTKGIGHTRFKQTPIGEIPEGWEVEKLGAISTIRSGGTPSRSEPSYWQGDIPWVKTGQINYSAITDSEEFITEKGISHSAASLFPVGTVLMAMYGQGATRGRVAWLGIPAATNQACAAFLSPKVESFFLYQFLACRYKELRQIGREGTQKNLSGALLKEISMPVPSRKEQKQIVEILSAKDETIRANENLLNQFKKTKSGLLQDLLTGKVRVSV